jgi:hypothetical protein
MATTLGFHIILACFGIAFPTIVLTAEFRGLSRSDDVAMRLARRWSQVMGVLVAVGAVTGTVLSFEMGLLWPGLMRTYRIGTTFRPGHHRGDFRRGRLAGHPVLPLAVLAARPPTARVGKPAGKG